MSPLLQSSSSLQLDQSPLHISPLVPGAESSLLQSSSALELNQSPLHISPLAKLHPAGEFFITEWIEQGQNLQFAKANTAVYFKVVRQERYMPAVRVVGLENNVTFCWLAPNQTIMMIPLLESETAKIEGRFMRAGSATGVRLALLIRVSVDQSKLVNGRVAPKSQAEGEKREKET